MSHEQRLSEELVSLCQSFDQALFEHRLDGYEKNEEIEFLRRYHLIVSAETAKSLVKSIESGAVPDQLPQWVESIGAAMSGWEPPERFEIDGDALWHALTSRAAECVCHLRHYRRCIVHPQHARLLTDVAHEVAELDDNEQERWRGFFFKHLLADAYNALRDSGSLPDSSVGEP